MLIYNYQKYKDVYTLENNGVLNLTYTIFKVECEIENLIKTKILPVSKKDNLLINLVDGVYRIRITNGTLTTTLPDILSFNNLLTSFICNTEEILCGCKDCYDCKETVICELYLETLVQALSINILNDNVYSNYLSIISQELKCYLSNEILYYITNKTLLGHSNSKKVYLKLIALYYLTFYFYDLSKAVDINEKEYVKNKYKSSKIFKCIKTLGINPENITNAFTKDLQVFYWQLNNTVLDITDVALIITQPYIESFPSASLNIFEQGSIVTYNETGRIVFAIQETDILNFLLLDSLGNDVTNEFDTQYFPLLKTVLFVSKTFYTISNMYFKFKINLL